jgi:hypothetical protein
LDVSVALTVKVRVVSALTVSVEGTLIVGGTRVPRKVNDAVAV